MASVQGSFPARKISSGATNSLVSAPLFQPFVGICTGCADIGRNGLNLANIVNGVGLTGGQFPGATHAAQTGANNFATSDEAATVNFTFDLNGLFNVAGMALWNNQNTPGINGVIVESSTDGVLFAPIVGAPSAFALAPVSGAQPAEIFAWAPVAATHIRFLGLSDHGAFLSRGLNEVLFIDDTAAAGVPEIGRTGATAPLAIVCLTLLIFGTGLKRVPLVAAQS